MDKLIGQRHYSGAPSPEIVRLRSIDADIHEETVDYFAEQARLLNIPIQIDHPIPAIRGWRLSRYGLLQSLAFDIDWDGPVEREHTSINRKGAAGFWAVKPSGVHIVEGYNPPVVGIVELSGRVVDHDFGWRGEVCTIVALFVTQHCHRHVYDALENRYQCDVFEGSLQMAARRLTG